MNRRLTTLVAALALLALVASGCGSGPGSGFETALSYVPKDAPLVLAFETDPKGKQFKQLKALIRKFPFAGQVNQGFKRGFNSRSGFDYDRDFKPLLGNELVVAITGAKAASGTPFVAAWKVKDEDAAKRLIAKNSSKSGKIGDAQVYSSKGGGGFTALDNGTLISAGKRPDLEAAVKRADGDHMSEDDFNARLQDLDKGALVRVAGNAEALLAADPKAAAARKVKWVGALRTFGAALSADPDGLRFGFRAKTEGTLGAQDLPLAAGAGAAPVVRRAGEIGFGLRNPAQMIAFAQSVSQITDPSGYAKYSRDKARKSKQLGIDIDRDVIGQLSGNMALSNALNGDFALRADLRDPAAAEATLRKAAPRLPKLAKGKSLGLSKPKGGKGFYGLAQANGKKVVFGVVGKSFVAATDASRAAQFAGQSPSVVPGAEGALVIASDARALANAAAAKSGKGQAAQLFTGALGDLIGSLRSETSGLTGDLKLQIK